MSPGQRIVSLGWIVLGLIGCASGRSTFVDPRSVVELEAGCRDAVFVSTGGSFPEASTTLAIRWAGYANFELAYRGQVLLLDAFFDRGSAYLSLGFAASDVRRVDGILIGHGHSDHMADAASIAMRTGAVVVGAPITVEALRDQGVAPEQTRSVRGLGDEVLRIGDFTVEPILARHGQPPSEVTGAFREALQSVTDPLTPAQIQERERYRARGASGPGIVDEGTIAYLITLDNGFRLLYRDSGGRVTDHERAAGERLGGVDVLLAPTASAYLNTLTAAQAVEYVRTYRPDVFIPGHHDAPYNNLWRATEPIFQAVKEEDPEIVTISRSYREPICFDTEVRRG